MRNIFKMLSLILVFSSTNFSYSQDNYCRWGVCKWGNDCMEGPEHIYGDHHPGCKTQWIKNNPEEWKEIQRKSAAVMGAVFALIAKEERKERLEKKRKEAAIKKAEDNEKRKYVRSRIAAHTNYSSQLSLVYNNEASKRNFIISYLAKNNYKLTSTAFERFSELNNLIAHVEKNSQKKIYRGNGMEYRNNLELPSNYLFFPEGGMPSLDNLEKIGTQIEKHLKNVNILETVFNAENNQRKNLILKFQIFKSLNLPINKLLKIKSYSQFLYLVNTSKQKSILNFSNLNQPYRQTEEAILLTEDFSQTILQNKSLMTYFFGNEENYNSFSVNDLEKIINENIYDYVSAFGKDYKEIPTKTKHILMFEDQILRDGRSYQAGGIRSEPDKNWKYKYSLLSPYNRYVFFRDFAIVYNHVIKRKLTAIEKKRFSDFKFKKLELSFKDYLKNENEYLTQLRLNMPRYVSFNENAYLVFTKSMFHKSVPLYRSIKSYNNKWRELGNFPSLSSSGLLKNQRKVEEAHEEAKILSNRTNKLIKISRGNVLLGYYLDKRSQTLKTFWDITSFYGSKDKEIWFQNLKAQKSYQRRSIRATSLWEPAIDFHHLFSEFQYEIRTGLIHSSAMLQYPLATEKEIKFSRESSNKSILFKPDKEIFERIFGLAKSNLLSSNGKKINFFISNTNNLEAFVSDFISNKEKIYIEVSEISYNPYLFRDYIEGMNLFFKTLIIDKRKGGLGTYSLESKSRKKKKKRRNKNKTEDNYTKFVLLNKK